MNWPSHGSNPRYIYETMNIPIPEQLIDLSANINPLGPPPILKEKWPAYFKHIGDYPDPNVTFLKEAISKKESVPKESILIGNGGAELITLLGRMFARKNVLIIQPAFSEYEQACLANDCHVYFHQLEEGWELSIDTLESDLVGMDAVFLCNPNNPTGVCFPYETILRLVEVCKGKGITVVIDEAFHDFWRNYQSLTPILQDFPNVILLRSLTKMYAIPGLRLGYVMADEKVIVELTNYQPHWSVNSVAILAGEECLKAKQHINQTIDYMNSERNKLFSFFEERGFEVSPSEVNFYLLRDSRCENQLSLFEFLLREGIVPRHTMNFPGLQGKWLRFAIKSSRENDRLLEVLEKWYR